MPGAGSREKEYTTKGHEREFPGGTVVKNPPASARDTGSLVVREDPTCRRATKPVHHNY